MLLAEIATLRREAERFNTPSTYFKCAKLQRQANAKEKELQALEEGRGPGALADTKLAGLVKLVTMAKVRSSSVHEHACGGALP